MNPKTKQTMKKILILIGGILVTALAAHVTFAQSNEGHIVYQIRVNMHRNIPKEREDMKNMIPEFREFKEELLFSNTESLYRPVEEDEEEEFGGDGMRIQMRRPQAEYYTDQAVSKRITLREFMGKQYLIEDSIKINPWKFGSETKTIAGHVCKQALLEIAINVNGEERKQTVTAWYTDQLRSFLGPENFNTLPGAILELDFNDGERLVTAKTIDIRPLKKNELKVPVKGVKVSEEEYRALVNEQMEKMRTNGGFIIRN